MFDIYIELGETLPHLRMESNAPDPINDLFRQMDEAREEADALVQSWQAAVKPGNYFCKRSPIGIPVYGVVLAEEEPREEFLQYYCFCRCYSVACPDGEMGDVHVSTIAEVISEERFKKIRMQGWIP